MSKIKERQKVLALRKRGYSYNQIQKNVTVSKSTLSSWLRDFPLSKLRIQELQGRNPKRIEKFRNTMKRKKEAEEKLVFDTMKTEIGRLSKREMLLAGLFLYWGEGTKAASCTIAMSNTDPNVLKFFMHWLNIFDIRNNQVRVVLHLYKDMDLEKETKYWSSYLKIPQNRFRKPYIKNSRFCDITYKSGFGHGTCNVLYYDKKLYLYVMSALRFIRIHA